MTLTASTDGAEPDRTALGITLIIASVFVMAFSDALVKLISKDVTLWQLFATRSVVAMVLMTGFIVISGGALLPRAPFWVLVRSALLCLTWLLFYASLPVLSLSVAAVVVYTNPIMTALFSALLIKEPVRRRQWAGVALGFLGVVAILRPGTDAFSWFAALPFLAAVSYSLAMVLTRSKCRNEPSLTLGLALQTVFLVTGILGTLGLVIVNLDSPSQAVFPFLLGDWAPMGLREWSLIGFLGLLSATYFVGVARAYQIAPPQIIATFDYTYLVSAALWGYVFFFEKPDVWTICGMVLITGAGLLVAMPVTRKMAANETAL